MLYLFSNYFKHGVKSCLQDNVLSTIQCLVYKKMSCLQENVLSSSQCFVYKTISCLQDNVLSTRQCLVNKTMSCLQDNVLPLRQYLVSKALYCLMWLVFMPYIIGFSSFCLMMCHLPWKQPFQPPSSMLASLADWRNVVLNLILSYQKWFVLYRWYNRYSLSWGLVNTLFLLSFLCISKFGPEILHGVLACIKKIWNMSYVTRSLLAAVLS